MIPVALSAACDELQRSGKLGELYYTSQCLSCPLQVIFAIGVGGFLGYLIFARDTCTDESLQADTPEKRGECCC